MWKPKHATDIRELGHYREPKPHQKAKNLLPYHRKNRMLKLSLEALQIVDAIDRRGSFSAAGKELFRVPSTISYTVAKLEEDLGVRIFERTGPRVALTPAGRELLKEGRYLLTAAGNLESRVRRVACGWETEITVGMDLVLSPMRLIDDIADFYKIADQTRLRLVLEALSGTWEALLDRRVDLLVGAPNVGPAGGGYTAEPIGEVAFVFAVAPVHPLAQADHPLTAADLQQHRAVAVADSARRLPARTVGLGLGQDVLTVPNMHVKYQFQMAGLGFGFLPEPYARDAIAAGLLVEKQVEEPRPPEALCLAWRTGEDGEALKWWIERIRTRVAQHTIESLMVGVDG
jgi:DNA-binding transcriptional LysR family regulator